MITVSVIVPIHNSRKYIEECIDSICHQTLRNIEILCIDSSTDGTTDILYNYQEEDNRIRIIEDKNSSYGYKLNLGIQKANGEYIAIVESDDYIAEDMLQKMYQIARRSNLDFVKGNYDGFMDTKDDRMFSRWNRVNEEHYNRIINLQKEKNMMPYVGYNIWTGIYKIEFLRNKMIVFHESEGASYQDIGFACLTAMLAERICFLQEGFYKYRMDNDGSSTSSCQKYLCVSSEFAWLWEQMKKLGCKTEENKVYFNICKTRSYFWNYQRLPEDYQEKLLRETPTGDLTDFNEGLLNCKIQEKENILKIFNGDLERIEYERELERKKKALYTRILHLFNKNRKIVLVCAGRQGGAVYTLMKLANCPAEITICDNYMQGKEFKWDRKKIVSIEDAVAKNKDGYYIIANYRNGSKIKEQIINLGIRESNIYLCEFIEENEFGLFQIFNKYSQG